MLILKWQQTSEISVVSEMGKYTSSEAIHSRTERLKVKILMYNMKS